MILNDKQKALIEKVGVALEQKGIRPAVARIRGLLLVADTPELTFEEIAEALQLSKSATSSSINSLLQCGVLEYITHPGDRKRYFRLKVNNWKEEFIKQVEDIASINSLLQQIADCRTASNPEYTAKIKEFASFLEFVTKHLPNMLQEWEKENLISPL